MGNNLEGYPENMKIKTFTQDCFDGATETEEAIKMKDKYLKRFRDLAYEFTEDCIKNQIESISQMLIRTFNKAEVINEVNK